MNRLAVAALIALALTGCQTLGGSSSSSGASTGAQPNVDVAGAVSAHLMTCLDKARATWPREQQVVKLRMRLTIEDDGRIARWEDAEPQRYEMDLVYKAASDAGGAALVHPVCGKVSIPSDQRATFRSFIFAPAPFEARIK